MKKVQQAPISADAVKILQFLYQTGYLTITDYDENRGRFTLDYPNLEVRKAFADFADRRRVK